MKPKYKVDYKNLEEYLKSLNYDEIETQWHKPEHPKLIQGKTMRSIDFFKLDKSKYPLNTLIEYGEPYLVDALGNDLSIVVLGKNKKYKLPDGRVIYSKFDCTIIADCLKNYGKYLNRVWKIPSQFLTKI